MFLNSYQDLQQLESWGDSNKLLQVMKNFQPQLYQSRLEIAFDNKFTSEHGASLEQLNTSLNLNYCKQFSETFDSLIWNESWNNNLILYSGNVTHLKNFSNETEVSIVNPSNEALIFGSGFNGAIYQSCGKTEMENAISDISQWKYKSFETSMQVSCPTGEIVVTSSFKMKESNGVDNIIHTAGPRGSVDNNRLLLSNCYRNSLRYFFEHSICNKRALILPCISTGKFGYPKIEACATALGCIRDFIIKEYTNEKSLIHSIDWKIIFITFESTEQAIYESFMGIFFNPSY